MARAVIRGVRVEGLKELNKALEELPKSTQKGVLRRVLVKAGQPIAETARSLAPVDEGELRDSIMVSTKIKNTVGNAEFAAAMSAGLGVAAARGAMRGARRAAGGGSFAEVHVGPAVAKNKADAIKRIVQEFGSIDQPGHPYMRPAWAQNQDLSLDIVKQELGDEIIKTTKRIASRAAAKAARSGNKKP